ncbi:MAG TPA: HAD family hydrolase [Planctomycetota bacterium]|nr:HAD family hydrolase [Planctomycetota bacterium]
MASASRRILVWVVLNKKNRMGKDAHATWVVWMLPKALIVNFWSVLYEDRSRAERLVRMQATLGKLLAEAGIDAAAETLAQICAALTTEPAADAADSAAGGSACPPLVQRVMEVSRKAGLPIPSQVAAAFARKASQAAVNFAPPSQFPDDFKMLKKLAEHYALVLVGNTTVPTGAGMREVLDGDHLLQFFRATVFSDEFGVNLPGAGLYEAALGFLRYEARDVWVIAGDSARDLPAARSLKLQTILVQRGATPKAEASVETVPSLQALVERLKAV